MTKQLSAISGQLFYQLNAESWSLTTIYGIQK